MSELVDRISEMGDGIEEFKVRHMKEVGGLKSQLVTERKEREGLELKLNRMGVGDGGGFRGAGVDTKALNDEREALGTFISRGDTSKLLELKAMTVGSDPSGGYLVLPTISGSMATKIFDQSPMKRLARLVSIPSGDSWQEAIDADEPDAQWVGETTARTETKEPTVGNHNVDLFEIFAAPQTTQKLLDTSYVDIASWLEGKLVDKFGRTEGVSFISGDGVVKPRGLLTRPIVSTSDATRAWGSLQYTASGDASGFGTSAADCIRNLVWSLRAPYRKGATWLMNSATAANIDRIKFAGTGEYVWRDGLTVGAPPSILGYPVEFDENMPDVGSGNYPIAFGNFQLAYVVVELSGLRVLRDPYSSKPNVIFYAYKRVGGDVSNSEAVKLLKIAAS